MNKKVERRNQVERRRDPGRRKEDKVEPEINDIGFGKSRVGSSTQKASPDYRPSIWSQFIRRIFK